MIHPDVQQALVEVASEIADPEHVYHRLQPDFPLPAVLVRAEQNDADVLATHRAQLEFYHEDMPTARNFGRTIIAHMTNGPHVTSAGMLDDVRVETHLREVPYPNPSIVMYTASVFVDTRAI